MGEQSEKVEQLEESKSEEQGERWCVVTGGRGFAARHLVEMLIRFDMFSVRIADLGPHITLDPSEQTGALGHAFQSGRVTYISCDLRHKSQVFKGLFPSSSSIFHFLYV